MDTEVKKAWVKALRSGDYKQGQNKLALRKPHGKTKHCCLGVLCEITPGVKRRQQFDPYFGIYEIAFDGEYGYLPPELRERIGLPGDEQEHLTVLNDSGKTFAEIADYIEEKL